MPNYYASRDWTFPLRQAYPTASYLEVAFGDFNGDGKLDVVLSYFSYPWQDVGIPIRLLAGDGAGQLTDITAATFPNGAPTTVFSRQNVVADFNKDGRLDVFFGGHGIDTAPFPGERNALMLSSGATGLVNATDRLPAITSNFTHSVGAADIDRDGDNDIFVNNSGNTPPYFLINDGQGNFSRDDTRLPAQLVADNRWNAVTFLDVDGDGDLDMFLGTATADRHANQLLLNDGAGRFTAAANVPLPATPQPIAQTQAIDASSADFNGDGRPDLIVHYTLYTAAPGVAGYTQILINRGDNTFADETLTRIPAPMNFVPNYNRVIVADMNGDGFLDLVAARSTTTPLYLNDGRGAFVQMPQGTIPYQPAGSYYPGDFNGDGRMDLLVDTGLYDGAEHYRVLLAQAFPTNQQGTAAAEGLMSGPTGTTILAGGGNDVVFGGAGQDFLRGEDGDDLIYGGAAFDDTHGNIGNDTVHGGDDGDWVVGGQGNDVLFGDDGGDVVLGNLANDTISGGPGLDWVRGGQGNDSIDAGAGDDLIWGDRGDDTISGGTGADTFSIFGEAGTDRILDFNAAEGDRVRVEPGYTFTAAQVGADTIVTLSGGAQMTLVGVQLNALPTTWIVQA